jgi:hypothetical protein
VHDEGRWAFLLSFDQKEKYVPQKGEKLVYCHPSWGSTFGAGHDLFIADECNANSNSYTNFPSTYSREGSKIVSRQQGYTDFSGAKANYHFRVFFE